MTADVQRELAEVEEWRPVPGYESRYMVSDQGQVWSLRRGAPITSYPNAAGYLVASLRRDSQSPSRKHRVHRLVLEAFVGPAPTGQVACHADGNRANNHLSNLRWDTPSANSFDAVSHGTHQWAAKTHCPQNHPYDEANTYIAARGDRQCRTCRRLRTRAPRLAEAQQVPCPTCGEKLRRDSLPRHNRSRHLAGAA